MENKNKFANWLQKRRYYIVLALCILSVCGTYALLKNATTPTPQYETPQTQAHFETAPTTEPLPDLAEYFPPELEVEPQAEPTESHPQSALPQTQESTLPVSGSAEVEKQTNNMQYPLNGKILKPFSGNTLVFSKTMSDWRVHNGIDIAAQTGTDVCACADGTIADIYTDERMGITIVIDHLNGLYSTYSNLSSGLLVEIGQSVSAGEVISTVGDSALFEAADESHLHFEMTQDGMQIDPLSVLK